MQTIFKFCMGFCNINLNHTCFHNIIQPSDHVGWGREYVMQGAITTPYECLSKHIQHDKLG